MAEQDFRVQKGIVVADGDVTVPSDHSVLAGTFDTNVSAAGVTLTGTTLAADGTDSNINIAITPKGTGEVDITKVDIASGEIDNTVIGGTTAAAGTFTSLTGTSLNLTEGNITNAGDINADSLSVDTAGSGLKLDFSGADTAKSIILMGDDLASALDITEGGNSYIKFTTTNSSETIVVSKPLDINSTSDFGSQAMTNVNIDSGAIDGTPIGANSAQSGKFTSVLATTHGRVGGTARESNTLLQINGVEVSAGGNLGGGGSNASADTIKYSEVRIHSDIANDDLAGMHVENMGGVYIIDNAENTPNTGQGSVFTVGRSGSGDSWGVGRQATTGKFHIGYSNVDYDNAADGTGNVMHPNQSVLMIDTSGNLTLEQNGAHLAFTGATSGGAAREIRFKASSNGISTNNTGSQTYLLPTDFPSGSSKVLQSTTSGALSWVAQTSGLSISGTDNQLVRMDGTGAVQNSTAVIDDSGNLTVSGTVSATNITGSDGMSVIKDTDGEFVALTLTNQSDSANTNGYVSQLFNLEDSGGNAVDAGKIAVKKNETFTATASTQDSNMEFHTSLNGTLTKRMEIKSDSVEVTGDLAVTGDLNITGDINAVSATELHVDDMTITVAKGAGSSSAANGAGFKVDGAGANILYAHAGTRFEMNKGLEVDGNMNVVGTISGDTSLTLDSTIITTAEIGVLDGVTPGTVTASKAVVVDGSKDIGTFGQITAGALSVDAVAVINTSSATSQSWTGSSAYVIADFAYATYRTVKFVGQVSDGTDVDVFEVLVTYKGASAPTNDAAIYMTTYAYIASSGTPLGSVSAVKDASGATVDIKFTPTSSGTYKYAVTATQLIKQ